MMDAVAESGNREKRPRVYNILTGIINTGVENERADAGRDNRTFLARPNYQARTETGRNKFSQFS